MRATPGDASRERTTLAELVAQADAQVVRLPGYEQELRGWQREPGDARPDGVPAAASRGAAASYRAPVVQRDFSLPGVSPAHDRGGVDAPLLAVLCTSRDRPLDHLRAGEALAAVLLEVTTAGGAGSSLNQPLELPHLRAQLQDRLALPGPPQVVLRLGVGGTVLPTPRRPGGHAGPSARA